MRLVYVLLSPTPGMHQYTADLANRMAADHEINLVTNRQWPADRYDARIRVHGVCRARNTGLAAESLRLWELTDIGRLLADLDPGLVHFTGPHLWNTALMRRLRREGTPILHTIHDLEPHSGTGYGRLLNYWNRAVIARADHILVHGEIFRRQLISEGVESGRVSAWPILHLFCSLRLQQALSVTPPEVVREPFVLFFGRQEPYKGIDVLLAAFDQLAGADALDGWRLVIAGPGRARTRPASLPGYVDWREEFVGDEAAVDLFRRCGVVALPYRDASQSALIPAAYFFSKPVVATTAGALPEYVENGQTGLLVGPGNADQLAAAILEITRDGKRGENMGVKGRQWYDSWRIEEARALFDLYASLALSNGK